MTRKIKRNPAAPKRARKLHEDDTNRALANIMTSVDFDETLRLVGPEQCIAVGVSGTARKIAAASEAGVSIKVVDWNDPGIQGDLLGGILSDEDRQKAGPGPFVVPVVVVFDDCTIVTHFAKSGPGGVS